MDKLRIRCGRGRFEATCLTTETCQHPTIPTPAQARLICSSGRGQSEARPRSSTSDINASFSSSCTGSRRHGRQRFSSLRKTLRWSGGALRFAHFPTCNSPIMQNFLRPAITLSPFGFSSGHSNTDGRVFWEPNTSHDIVSTPHHPAYYPVTTTDNRSEDGPKDGHPRWNTDLGVSSSTD